MNKVVTRESLINLLNDHARLDKVIGRALVVIFNNQTNSEKTSNTTNNNNFVGFTGADAFSGCIHAKYFIKHGTLAEWMIDKWMKPNKNDIPRIAKYHSQLNEAAIKKEQTK